MNYQDYPKQMRHPGYKPAVPYQQKRYKAGEEGWGVPIHPGETGSPAKFPDVMVNNMDQEQEYASKGYVPAGKSDPEAYRRAMTNNEPKPVSTFVEYPKVLYRAVNHGTKDMPYEERVVRDSREETALGLGWYRTPGEALGWGKPKEEVKSVETSDPIPDKKPKKKGMSEEERAKKSEMMKKRWADRKSKSSEVHA